MDNIEAVEARRPELLAMGVNPLAAGMQASFDIIGPIGEYDCIHVYGEDGKRIPNNLKPITRRNRED